MRKLTVAAMIALAGFAVPAAAQFSDAYNFLKSVRDNDMYKAQGFVRQPGSTVVNTRDSESGDQAMHIVTRKRDTAWMRFLLGNGADINGRDRAGNTPLLLAASGGFDEGVRLLVSVGASVNIANNSGETALIKAVQLRDTDSVTVLLAAGANPNQTDNVAGMSAKDYAGQDRRAANIQKLIESIKPLKSPGMMGPSR